MSHNQSEINRALQALGVSTIEMVAIFNAPYQQALALLQDVQTRAKQTYKKLAFEYHPDRTNSDASKSEFFVLLGHVLEDLGKIRLEAPVIKPSTKIPRPKVRFSLKQVQRIVRMRP